MEMQKTAINNSSTYINSMRTLHSNAYVMVYGNIMKVNAFNTLLY